MRKGLIASVSLATMLLVGSCGLTPETPPVKDSNPFTVVRHPNTNQYLSSLYTGCMGKDKIFMFDRGIAVVHNHEECK